MTCRLHRSVPVLGLAPIVGSAPIVRSAPVVRLAPIIGSPLIPGWAIIILSASTVELASVVPAVSVLLSSPCLGCSMLPDLTGGTRLLTAGPEPRGARRPVASVGWVRQMSVLAVRRVDAHYGLGAAGSQAHLERMKRQAGDRANPLSDEPVVVPDGADVFALLVEDAYHLAGRTAAAPKSTLSLFNPPLEEPSQCTSCLYST